MPGPQDYDLFVLIFLCLYDFLPLVIFVSYNNKMWNVLSGNRLIDRRRKEEAQKKHLIALNKVRSQINNSAPREYSFLNSRPKANQLKYCKLVVTQNDRSTSKIIITS